MQGERTRRVAQLVRETIMEALSFGEVRDPRVSGAGLITVTHVEVTGDLRMAKVYVVVHLGDPKEVVEGLRAAAGFLRRQVGERLRAKATPELRFFADTEYEKGQKIEELLAEVAEKPKDGET